MPATANANVIGAPRPSTRYWCIDTVAVMTLSPSSSAVPVESSSSAGARTARANDDAPAADLRGSVLAILGGTGEQGRGLGARLAAGGVAVVLGSRDASRAREVADEVTRLARRFAGSDAVPVTGARNVDAVIGAQIVIVAVPWSAHAATIAESADALAGRILVDCVNPLGFDSQGAYALPVAEGSAAAQAAQLAPDADVVVAFNHISAVTLLNPDIARVDADVLVLGDSRPATDRVQALAEMIPGVRGVYAGRLRLAGQVEALTANLIAINRRYRAHAGLRVTDIAHGQP